MIGIVFSLLYAFNAWLGSVAGTCTMGDDGYFIASIIYSIPIILIAGCCLWLSRRIEGYSVYALFLPALSAISVAFIWLPILWNTTVIGHHLCGEEYNIYFTGSYVFERLVPIIHVAFVALLLALSSPVFRKERARDN
jgi:hypothetical protein